MVLYEFIQRRELVDISKSIKVSLQKKKWNQRELAEAMDTTSAAISTIISKGSCHTKTLGELGKAFNVKVSTFIARGEK